METLPTVRDYMTESTHALHPEDDVYTAIKILLKKNHGGLPVVDDENRLVGVLNEKDCIRVLSNAAYGNFGLAHVRDYMAPPVVTVSPRTDLFTAASVFSTTQFAVLPVVDDNVLVGRICRRDVLRGIVDLEKHLQGNYTHEQAVHEMVDHSHDAFVHLQHLIASSNKSQLAEVLGQPHGHGKGHRK